MLFRLQRQPSRGQRHARRDFIATLFQSSVCGGDQLVGNAIAGLQALCGQSKGLERSAQGDTFGQRIQQILMPALLEIDIDQAFVDLDGGFEFGEFLLIVAPPGLLYLAAATLVSHAPFEIDSWSDHFWRVRRRFFAYLLGYLASLIFTSFVLQGVPLVHPLRVLQLLLAATLITGLVAARPRVHMLLAGFVSMVALAVAMLAIAGILRLDPKQIRLMHYALLNAKIGTSVC